MLAITRPISDSFQDCALTHVERAPIDLARAHHQHETYIQALAGLGCEIIALSPEPDLPDAVFVEDTAVVLDEVAVISRPGHETRRRETPSVEAALRPHRPIERIEPPATLDGGDVLHAGPTLFVGRSRRTNEAGIEQLRAIAAPHGLTVIPVEVRGCLHLKSACTRIGPELLIVNREWLDAEALEGFDLLDVDPREPWAANQLLVGDTVISPAAPRTAERIRSHGIDVEMVDTSELAKAEGGVTCCSILLEKRRHAPFPGHDSAQTVVYSSRRVESPADVP